MSLRSGLVTSHLTSAWKHADELGPGIEPWQAELAAWAQDEHVLK
ncbi:hypothetical protein [Dermacoccus barathri]